MTRQAQVISSLVARNLRVAQAAEQVPNVELAARVGVAARTVGKWRHGEVDITLASLERVARALGRDVSWFLADHDPEDVAA